MKKLYFLLLFHFSLIISVFGQETNFFINPVIRGDIAEPSIIRIDDTYYATGTSSEWAPYYPVFV